MRPVYVPKKNPRRRTTWMDNFIASEPKSGFRQVFDLSRKPRT